MYLYTHYYLWFSRETKMIRNKFHKSNLRIFTSFKVYIAKNDNFVLEDSIFGLTDYKYKIVLINANLSTYERFYTLMHELMHVIIYKIAPSAKIGSKIDALHDYVDFLIDFTHFKENYKAIRKHGFNILNVIREYFKRYEKRFMKYGYKKALKRFERLGEALSKPESVKKTKKGGDRLNGFENSALAEIEYKKKVELEKMAEKGNIYAKYQILYELRGLPTNLQALMPKPDCKHVKIVGRRQVETIMPLAPKEVGEFVVKAWICTQCGKTVKMEILKPKRPRRLNEK